MKPKVLLLQGPNLNLLGNREPHLYGSRTMAEIHAGLREEAVGLGVEIDFFQSNHEGALIDRIHQAGAEGFVGILINAAGLTHTSVSLRDALGGTGIPFVEVHISNVFSREDFRHHSYLSPLAAGIVVGFGIDGYRLGLLGLTRIITESPKSPV